jgi:hypothetical protein
LQKKLQEAKDRADVKSDPSRISKKLVRAEKSRTEKLENKL